MFTGRSIMLSTTPHPSKLFPFNIKCDTSNFVRRIAFDDEEVCPERQCLHSSHRKANSLHTKLFHTRLHIRHRSCLNFCPHFCSHLTSLLLQDGETMEGSLQTTWTEDVRYNQKVGLAIRTFPLFHIQSNSHTALFHSLSNAIQCTCSYT